MIINDRLFYEAQKIEPDDQVTLVPMEDQNIFDSDYLMTNYDLICDLIKAHTKSKDAASIQNLIDDGLCIYIMHDQSILAEALRAYNKTLPDDQKLPVFEEFLGRSFFFAGNQFRDDEINSNLFQDPSGKRKQVFLNFVNHEL